MSSKVFIASLIAATQIALPASAEVQLAGDLQFSLFRNSDTSENFKRLEASFHTGLSERIGLQADIAAAKYEGLTSTAPSVGLHLTYSLGSDTMLGAFVTGEDLRTGNYLYYGVEVLQKFEAFSFEAYVAGVDVLNSPSSGTRMGIDARFGLGQKKRGTEPVFALRAGAHTANFTASENSYVYFGADYRLKNGVVLSAIAGHTDAGDTVVGLSATVSFGGGAAFGRRDFRGAFPGY